MHIQATTMAEGKLAVVAVLFVVAVASLMPAANADACNDECYKGCEKGKKEDVPSCTSTCDDMCRLKSTSKLYAAATPEEKAAIAKTFEKEALAASSATATAPTPGFATLNAGCLRECNNNLCGGTAGKQDPAACATRCDNVCREEVDGLAYSAKTYDESPATEKEAAIQAIDKHASAPSDKVEVLAATCIDDCVKLCEKDPACVAICDNGCRGRSVNLAFSLSTPAEKKDETKKVIQAVSATASKLLGK